MSISRNGSAAASANGLPVDGREPVAVARIFAAHGAEVELLQLSRVASDAAIADRAVVDFDDRRDLSAGATQQQLLAGVQLSAVDRALDHLESELIANQTDHQLARNPFEDVLGDGRSVEDAIAQHEQVFGR